MSERKSSERVDIRIWVLTLALVLNLVFLGYRIAVTSKATFNSDSATTSLYAGEILKSGRLIPPDWHFNNGDVWLYNHTLFAVPLLTMLPNGYTVYAASTGIFALLIVLAIALAMRALSAGRLAMLAAAAVLASGISSPFIADLVYDWGATYGSQFLLALFELVLLVRIVERASGGARQSIPTGKIALLCLLVLISSASNPARAVMYHFLPYIVGMGIAWFQFAHQRPELGSLAQSSMAKRTYATTLIAFTCAFLLGTYLHIQMIGVMGGVLANPPIYGADTLVPHVGSILTSWLYLGGYPIGGPLSTSAMRVAQLSPLGLYFTARIVLALAILVLPFAFVRQAIVHKQRAGRMPIVAWVPIIALLLAGFFHLTSFRYPRPDDYTSIRYLVVPLLLVGVASGALASHAIERALGKPWNAAMLAGAAVFLGFMNNVFPATRYAPPLMPLAGKNPNLAIVECLQRHGFQYGYGGFWSSNALTVLSDSAVKVRPVSISARSIDMFPAHTADNWYDPAAWLGTSFLLLSDSEYRTVERSWLLGRLGEGERTIQCGSFTAIGYGYNIARRLFGNIEKSIDIDIGESTPHQIGRFISQNEMRSLAGETGYLLFGPYLSVKKGRYEARLTIRNLTSGDGDGDVGIMDVVAAKGEKTLAKTELSTGHLAGELKLPFILDFDARDVEIRVYSNGRAALAVSGPIEVRNAASSAVGPQ